MKTILIALCMLSIGCSAVLTNKPTSMGIDPCNKALYIDAGLSGAAATTRFMLKDSGHQDADLHRTALTMLAVGFATSALMGYGDCHLKE